MPKAASFGLSVLFLCAVACSETEYAPEQTLMTSELSVGDVTKMISATGKIEPVEKVMVGSEVSGKVIDVLVDFNAQVEVGEILARIDPTSYTSRVSQIENRIASALSNIDVQNAQIERANVALVNARQELERREKLFEGDATSRSVYEAAQRDFGIAEADLKLAKAQLAASRASVRQQRAELADAKANLDRTTIRSPINGVVLDRKIDPGQTVQASFSAPELFIIAADLSKIQVEATIVEADVSDLAPGDSARFSVDAYPDLKVDGLVEQLRLKSSEENNIVSYTAVISAANPAGRLLPGMTANLQIITDIKSNVMRIPVTAERFRPAPGEIERFNVKDQADASEPEGLLDPTYARLSVIGLSEARIEAFGEVIEPDTQALRDIINDPTKSFMHTPSKIALAEQVEAGLTQFLTPPERERYTSQLALERSIRPVELWVGVGTDGMQRRQVKLGLSDGTFVVVHEGLSAEDKVVTGIRTEQPAS